MLPSVQGIEGDASAFGASVRDLFASFLRGPSLQVVLLDARLSSHAVEETRQKQCPHLLTATLTRKRSGTGGGLLGTVIGQAGSSVAWGIPGGGIGGAVARGAAVAASQAVSDLASTTRAKDEIRLEYRLQSVEGKTMSGPTTEKAKASVDGEDLVTPLVGKASEAIVAAVARK
jgi:hypothetical protein